jgi:cytochrome c oxidase assembly protein subunit 15
VKLDRFQKLALWTTGATYLLIGVGGLVRAAGAGLGCPDWPKCFDRWIPPVSVEGVPAHIDPALFNFAKAWMEYVNRLLGVAIGFLIFATLVAAIVKHRRTPRVLWPSVGAFVLVAFQGWLGGQVVESGLKPIVLTAHLVLALVIVSLLLYATVSAFFPSGRAPAPLSTERRWLGRAVVATLVLLLVQIGLGADLRGEIQLAAEAGVARGAWLDAVGLIDPIHRSVAVLVTGAIVALAALASRVAPGDPWLARVSKIALALVAIQVLAGIGLAELGFPRVLVVVHLWAAALLLGDLTLMALLVVRLDPRIRTDRAAPPAPGVAVSAP